MKVAAVVLASLLGLAVVAKSDDTEVLVPGRFYQQDILFYPSSTITYYAVDICDTGKYKQLTISIAQPYNTAWDPDLGNVYLEVSAEKETWEESTVVATNYDYSNGDGDVVFLTSVTIDLDNSSFPNDEIYLRLKGAGVQTAATWEITFDEGNEASSGSYDGFVFNENSPSRSTVWNSASEYARTSKAEEVDNGAYSRMIFSFCGGNFPWDPSSDWGVTVTVVGDAEYPESGFNLYMCPGNWDPDTCKVTKYIDHNDDAISVVTGTIRNGEQDTSIEDGITAAVLGIGGSGTNYFTATATLLSPET